MDRGGFPANDSISISSSTANTNREMNTVHQHLKQLNKNSHKITKPIRNPLPPDPNPPNPGQTQTQSHQPPVYTINKDDFRDVVQRLTGSPIPPTPPPPPIITPHPRPLTSSRLQRIRPPPLFTSPPPPQNGVVSQSLPPLPSVHSAAESPVSAYMRFLHSSSSSAAAPSPVSNLGQQAQQPASPISAYMRFLQNSANTSMPQWNDVAPTPQQQQQQQQTMSSAFPGVLLSPVPFGCAQSPRSLYGLLSPSQLFSPTGGGHLGFPQLPLSPSPPVPSPR